MRPYPAYKDSGVEWLGEVPDGWEVKRLRHLVRVKTDKATTATNPIALENIESWSGRITPTDTEFQGDGTAFEAGDILFGKLRPYLAKVAIAHCSGEAVGDFHVLRPSAGVLPRFIQLGLLTPSVISIIDGSTYGSKMPRASWDFMADLCFALPPLPEQQAIARFLDKEVAKIDALVAEQRRLIALLAEKRQAVISHAVTKGLNPATPLKPSGIDWLGDIPEGWEVVPLKHLSPAISVGVVVNPSNYVAEEGLPFIYGGDISEGVIAYEKARRISAADSSELAKSQLRAGDLLTVRVGAPGVTAVVGPEGEGGNCASVMLIRRGKHPSQWLCYAMNSRHVRFQVEIVQYGAAQEQFNISHAVDFRIVTPPVEEAQAISNFLDAQTTQLDTLTTTAQSAISLLQERRAALISAAVTGKIDLRPHFAQSLSEPETA
jgi:type I restriction enzyme S subunit